MSPPGGAGRGARGLLLSAFGLGRVPRAPGTAASLATALLLFAAAPLGPAACWLAAGLAVTGAAACLLLGKEVVGETGHGDPGWVVADEVAGQALASLGALLAGAAPWIHGAAFLLFRVLDVAKPGPIGRLERIPGGAGVLLDDVGAGLLAGALAAGLTLL